MAYLIAINRTIRGKLPPTATPSQWAAFNDAFTTADLTAGQIAAEIRAGHAIAADHGNRRRKRAHWQCAQHVGIDLDDGALSWDELIALPLVVDHAAIVHTTASHRPDNPRFRVLFLLEEPLTDPDSYAYVVGCFLRAFATADPHCADPSRLFFGAPDCSLLLQAENVVTSEDLANIVTAWPPEEWPGDVGRLDDDPADDDAPRPRAIGFRTSAPPAGGDIIPPADISAHRLDAHSEALLDKIRQAPDGAKWATLRDVAITFGGYVQAGYYNRTEIERRLRAAIETRRSTVASMPAAYKTIEIGLAYGAIRGPLWYTRGDDRPRPPASSSGYYTPAGAVVTNGDDFRRALIAARLTELEQLINAVDLDGDAPDLEKWVIEYDELQTALRAGVT